MNGSVLEEIVTRILATLRKIDASVIASEHIGIRQPHAAGDSPLIAVSVADLAVTSVGIGELIGSVRDDADRVSEVRGSRASGVLQLEVWAQQLEKVEELSMAISRVLEVARAGLKKQGFLGLQVSSLGAVQERKISDGVALLRVLQFRVIFEYQDAREIHPEELINTIRVNIDSELDERMEIQ